MGRNEPTHLVVGHVNKPHGTKGEVFVWPLTDHPEGVFSPGVVLFSGDGTGMEPDPDRPRLRIDGVRPFRKGFLVTFGGVQDRNDAEALRDLYLYQARDELAPLEEGEVFYHQLLGMRVETAGGEPVGTIQEVYELRPADLLELSTDGGTLLVPFIEDVVVEVFPEEGRMVIDPPEGLLDLEA